MRFAVVFATLSVVLSGALANPVANPEANPNPNPNPNPVALPEPIITAAPEKRESWKLLDPCIPTVKANGRAGIKHCTTDPRPTGCIGKGADGKPVCYWW